MYVSAHVFCVQSVLPLPPPFHSWVVWEETKIGCEVGCLLCPVGAALEGRDGSREEQLIAVVVSGDASGVSGSVGAWHEGEEDTAGQHGVVGRTHS